MKRRSVLQGLLFFTSASVSSPATVLADRRAIVPERESRYATYERNIIIDALASPLQFNIPQGQLPLTRESLNQIRSAGITAVNITVNAFGSGESDYDASVKKMQAWTTQLAHRPEFMMQIMSVADIHEAKATNKLGLIFGFQDGTPFEDDLARIDLFQDMGVRIIQPTYNRQNKLGAGCLVAKDNGLTPLGIESVERIEAQHILLDLSHCGPKTTSDGINAAKGPVAITHTGATSIFNHPRNKSDATLRNLARRGGVAGVYLMPFLNQAGAPSLIHVVSHIEHMLNICGEDHVGIGSDQGIVPLDTSGDFATRFAEVSRRRAAAGIAAPREDTVPYVPDLNHPRRLETIASALSGRGITDRVIEKILGLNFLRLFSEVWKT